MNAGSAAYFLSSKRTRTVLPPLNPACRHPASVPRRKNKLPRPLPGRGIDRKKPLYRPQWLSTAAYKGFGLQLLTTAYNDLQRLCFSTFSTESGALFLASCAHATFHILRMHRSQRFTHSEYTASRVPYTTSHVLRIHRFTHSEYNISRVPYTSFRAFRIHRFTLSEYNVSLIPYIFVF